MDVLQYALLGIGAGAIYGLLAQGIVIIYRSSRVINLSQGAIAMVGGYLFMQFRDRYRINGSLAFILVIVVTCALGWILYFAIFKTLRNSATLTRMIASLGVLLTLESGAAIIYKSDLILIPSFLPNKAVEPLKNTFIGEDQLAIFAIGIVAATLLWLLYAKTAFGRESTAIAEDVETAEGLGVSSTRVAAINWILASGVAGMSGALIAPITGLQPATLSELVIPALAAALVSSFASFPMAFCAGLVIGIAESEVGRFVATPGWQSAVPYIAIAALCVARGTRFPGRANNVERMPEPVRVASRWPAIITVVVLVVLAEILGGAWTAAFTTSCAVATIALSVVVVTGFAGQLSLATYGVAGAGALTAARLSQDLHCPFLLALLLGGIAGGAVGFCIGLPSLRTRGYVLAILTLGFGSIIQDVVFSNLAYAGGPSGVQLGTLGVFGIDIDSVTNPQGYALFCAIILSLSYLGVRYLRSSRLGTRMLALRANETAAAAAGVNVPLTKLLSFTIASFIAGIGGVLLTSQSGVVTVDTGFDITASLTIVGFAVLGSVAYPAGALIAGCMISGGLVSNIFNFWPSINEYIPLIGGVGLILTVLGQPDGLAAKYSQVARRVMRLKERPIDLARPKEEAAPPQLVRASLRVNNITVRYGGTTAVSDVSLILEPGRVVGVVGPNGAGKTSLIDAITGLTKCRGSIELDGRDISAMPPHRRARLGIGRSFQSVELFNDLSVFENLRVVGAQSPGIRNGLNIRRSLSPATTRAVSEFKLGSELLRLPVELNFGARRLLGVARAIGAVPSALLLDEPCAGLDADEVDEMAALIRRLADDWGMAVLLVEHHLAMVSSVCDEVVVMAEARVLARGLPSEVFAQQDVTDAYLGQAGNRKGSYAGE